MLHITNNSFYTCQPQTKYELREIVIQRIKDDGPECNLNDIDVSKITDMSYLFNANNNWNSRNAIFKDFNGDVSLWDVSNVKDMSWMFNRCEKFNCDISKWDVSNVTNMHGMFNLCEKFNCDISRWDVSNVYDMNGIFNECPAQPKWYNKDLWGY